MQHADLIVRFVLTIVWRGGIQVAALLGPAGTFWWPKAWVLIAITVLGNALSFSLLWFRDKGLLRERVGGAFQSGQGWADRVLLLALMATFIASLFASSIDVWQLRLLPIETTVVAIVGLAMVLGGSWLWVRSLRINSFGSIVVKHQGEREHAVVDRDVYGIVRHPMYSGILLVLLGQPIWLGSGLGVLVALIGLIILGVRVINEEKLLVAELDGYDSYRQRVRYRIVPGIW